jgi:hypothetical protein
MNEELDACPNRQRLPGLSDWLRNHLQTKYGSVVKAADSLGLPYDNFKRALRLNKFSLSTLQAIFPDTSVDDLRKKYQFADTRPYTVSSDGAARKDSTGHHRRYAALERVVAAFDNAPILDKLRAAKVILAREEDRSFASHEAAEIAIAGRLVEDVIEVLENHPRAAQLTKNAPPSSDCV